MRVPQDEERQMEYALTRRQQFQQLKTRMGQGG